VKLEESYDLFTRLRQRMLVLLKAMDNPHPFPERVEHALGGSIKFSDCNVVQRLLEAHKPKRCLEIGSFLGFSTRWLLECGASWNMHVTAVDPNVRHRVFDNPRWMVEGMNAPFIPDRLEIISGFFGAHGVWMDDYTRYLPHRPEEWVRTLFADRVELDGSWDRTFDCIYIDADHSYASVTDGFRHALRLLEPGGMMLFHDALTWKGVNQALREFKVEFDGTARVEILDGTNVFDHPKLQSEIIKAADGIGLFKLRRQSNAMAELAAELEDRREPAADTRDGHRGQPTSEDSRRTPVERAAQV
jgi:predicted O-methyltransferase YrrM